MVRPPLFLVVTRGPATGARLRLDTQPRIVGRARDADLVLPDIHVSRRHLTVTEAEGGARIEVCEGAKSLLVGGVARRSALVPVGDGIVIGDTTIAVVATSPSESRIPLGTVRTDVKTLMTGAAADVRGLATVIELVDSLDVAGDEPGVTEALRAWGADHLSATDVTLVAADDPALDLEPGVRPVVERPGPREGRVLLSAPIHGEESGWLTFEVATGSVTGTTRRLAAVAGHLVAVSLARLRAAREAAEEREALRRQEVGSARSFLGDSPGALGVAKLVPRLAASESVVLIEGETGVGKTFLARLLHEASPRAKEALRVVNCAAIPETLIESELFGHERGAFTGAATARPGVFEAAGKGTVLLDEIGELPLVSQAKLLRVLEEKRFERLGSNRSVSLAARVLVATNRDLAAMVEEGTFRRDLFYRIAVVKLRVPALRERGEDLILLAQRVLADLATSAGRRVDGFSPAALDAIRRYSWPGNVRELKNAIERALVVGDGKLIEPSDLPEAVHGAPEPQPADQMMIRLPARMDWIEERAIAAALHATSGNQTQAAALLGLSRSTLRRKLSPGDAGREGEEDDGA
jgi:DNA-binding NtrC family response regulator/pSer/pThr/pTyr-binding forkhead associated (FHA) protein